MMNNITQLDAALLKRMITSAAAELTNKRREVDDLNVFPVPDGDTGTNMSLTFSGAAAAAAEYETDRADKLLSKLASAALRNARGNSGVILSQIIRGFSKGVEGKKTLSAEDIKNGLVSSKTTAYRAVMKPTEGTILTVIREISEFAEENYTVFGSLSEFAHAILDAGEKSLESTTELLPALKQAGVVDAGGKGLITIAEGLVHILDGGEEIVSTEQTAAHAGAHGAAAASDVPVDIKYHYCTEFIINKDNQRRKVTQFRSAISEKGDCMLVIDDEDIVKVHIHTNHPGCVIEQALKLGELTNLKIDNMKYQHDSKVITAEQSAATEAKAAAAAKPKKKFGFAAVSAGSGLTELFRSLDVDEIIEGGQTMNPSTEELLSAVERIPAETVFILPNNKNIIMAAEQVAPLTKKDIRVIPTVNIPQGITAVSAFDDSLSADDNAAAMTELCAEVKCGQVTYAARDTVLDGTEIKKGDCLGICGSRIDCVSDSPEKAATALAEEMTDDDSGIISVYYGADVDAETAQTLADSLAEKYPELDVSLNFGGQPVYCYIISVE